ncbi:MAG: 3-deoxy-D-manno-octulosonate 8-phosphate phosphatase KdsC [Myxococcota bacterium]|nr:3-deoxy-D-manno-octulosonate 8-phosphate phosphatase KdsC [Myxococcota bacterium]
MPRLSIHELKQRARRIRLVLSDCDGVLTDGTVFVSPDGERLKQFSLRDGMGVERLRAQGVETAIITRENSPIVARRADKLKMPHLFMGVMDKRAHLEVIMRETGAVLAELAYIGDDFNDLDVIEAIGAAGLTGAPSDAQPAVAAAAHFNTLAPGGKGAFREFAEWLIEWRTT